MAGRGVRIFVTAGVSFPAHGRTGWMIAAAAWQIGSPRGWELTAHEGTGPHQGPFRQGLLQGQPQQGEIRNETKGRAEGGGEAEGSRQGRQGAGEDRAESP